MAYVTVAYAGSGVHLTLCAGCRAAQQAVAVASGQGLTKLDRMTCEDGCKRNGCLTAPRHCVCSLSQSSHMAIWLLLAVE